MYPVVQGSKWLLRVDGLKTKAMPVLRLLERPVPKSAPEHRAKDDDRPQQQSEDAVVQCEEDAGREDQGHADNPQEQAGHRGQR